MTHYIYKVVPAPAKGEKASGVKSAEARFALGLETAINGAAREGWEYLRAEILPSQERQGLAGTRTVQRSMLVFRRPAGAAGTAGITPTAEEPAVETSTVRPPLFARRDPPLNSGRAVGHATPQQPDGATETGGTAAARPGEDTRRP